MRSDRSGLRIWCVFFSGLFTEARPMFGVCWDSACCLGPNIHNLHNPLPEGKKKLKLKSKSTINPEYPESCPKHLDQSFVPTTITHIPAPHQNTMLPQKFHDAQTSGLMTKYYDEHHVHDAQNSNLMTKPRKFHDEPKLMNTVNIITKTPRK